MPKETIKVRKPDPTTGQVWRLSVGWSAPGRGVQVNGRDDEKNGDPHGGSFNLTHSEVSRLIRALKRARKAVYGPGKP